MKNLISKEITMNKLFEEMKENGYHDESDMADSTLEDVLESGVITFLERESDNTKNVEFEVTIKADKKEEWLGASYIKIIDIA